MSRDLPVGLVSQRQLEPPSLPKNIHPSFPTRQEHDRLAIIRTHLIAFANVYECYAPESGFNTGTPLMNALTLTSVEDVKERCITRI